MVSAVPTRQPVCLDAAITSGGKVPATVATTRWLQWLQELVSAVNGSAQSFLPSVALNTQSASLASTAVTKALVAAALVRVSWYARITQAAGASSSLTIVISWTDGGVACSGGGVAMTGNVTSLTQSGSLVVHADTGTKIFVTATYASSGAPVMQYALDVVAEQMAA